MYFCLLCCIALYELHCSIHYLLSLAFPRCIHTMADRLTVLCFSLYAKSDDVTFAAERL